MVPLSFRSSVDVMERPFPGVNWQVAPRSLPQSLPRPEKKQKRNQNTVLMPVLPPTPVAPPEGDFATSAVYLAVKRTLDVCVASIALLVLAPVLLLIALAILWEDGGPVLFWQNRVGRDGKLFRFYKFRSMVRDAERLKETLAAHNEAAGPIFKMRQDPRVTRVGRVLRKYSLDELPQLFNVLRGDMSLVGPRPHLPQEVALYTARHRQRLSVRPGLVCLREVHGRSNLSFERWIELDLIYIAYRSLRTDLRILWHLVPAVLRAEGAY